MYTEFHTVTLVQGYCRSDLLKPSMNCPKDIVFKEIDSWNLTANMYKLVKNRRITATLVTFATKVFSKNEAEMQILKDFYLRSPVKWIAMIYKNEAKW